MKLRNLEEIKSKFSKDFAEVEAMFKRINDLCDTDAITSRERHLLAVSLMNREQALVENKRYALIDAILYYSQSYTRESLQRMFHRQLEEILEEVSSEVLA